VVRASPLSKHTISVTGYTRTGRVLQLRVVTPHTHAHAPYEHIWHKVVPTCGQHEHIDTRLRTCTGRRRMSDHIDLRR
jgi:hypothetical protein